MSYLEKINKAYLVFLYYLISLIDYKNNKKVKIFFKNKFKESSLVVIDIGAHKGETINFFLKNFNIKNIYAFEPNINVFRIIEKKYKKINNIHVFNLGLGDKERNGNLNILKDTSSSTFMHLNKDSKYFKRKAKIINLLSKNIFTSNEKVKIITLNDFFTIHKINFIDILKIDTEGYEFKILKGLSNNNFRNIKYIYFEHHYDLMIKKNYTFSQIRNLLEKNNFKMAFKIKMPFRKTFEYIYENQN